MAIVSSGTISLLDLQNEFGGTNPISINEYYAAAGLVPPGTINGSGSALITSGQISLPSFYGSRQIPAALPVRVLIVGGGGGGRPRNGGDNSNWCGAGGAGGYVDAAFNLPKGTYGFTIGASSGGQGSDTAAFGYTAFGGGYGGPSDNQPGSSGGSGGGGAGNYGAGGSATQPGSTSGNFGGQPGYGNSGAQGGAGAGSGGGGAGSAGSGISGGSGRQWINGTYYSGGGGATGAGGTSGGGGGTGGNATYYGGGAGGSYNNSGPQITTIGYQGIVIISYQWNFQLISGGAVSSSGSGITTQWYHAITSSSTTITF